MALCHLSSTMILPDMEVSVPRPPKREVIDEVAAQEDVVLSKSLYYLMTSMEVWRSLQYTSNLT